jgi:hypothetical protein
METKIELEVITNQLQSSLDELKRKRIDRNLIHDYITEALSRVKKLNKPAVINNEAEASSEGMAVCCDTCKYVDGFRCNHPQGCETYGDYELWEQRTDL